MEEPACGSDVGKAYLPATGCAICHNLMPETLQYLKPGQRATMFAYEYELLQSAISAVCDECKLLFDAVGVEMDKMGVGKGSILIYRDQTCCRRASTHLVEHQRYLPADLPSSYCMTQEEARGLSTVTGRYPLISEDSGSKKSLSLLNSWYEE